VTTQLTGSGVAALAGIVVIGGVAYWLYQHREAIGNAINPLSDKNLASRAADAFTQKMTGDPTQTVGGWLFDFFNPNVFNPKDFTGSTIPPQPLAAQVPGAGNVTTPGWEGNPMGLAGWHPALNGATGRWELVPPLTPTTWAVIAGISALLYVSKQKKRRRRTRR
jgi:hypothetical protein